VQFQPNSHIDAIGCRLRRTNASLRPLQRGGNSESHHGVPRYL